MPVLYGRVSGSNSLPRASAPTTTGSKPASRTSRATGLHRLGVVTGHRNPDRICLSMRLARKDLELHCVERLDPSASRKHRSRPACRALWMLPRLVRRVSVTPLVGVFRIEHDFADERRRQIVRENGDGPQWSRSQPAACARSRSDCHEHAVRTMTGILFVSSLIFGRATNSIPSTWPGRRMPVPITSTLGALVSASAADETGTGRKHRRRRYSVYVSR
jgi:hypothetical protein